PADPIHHVRVEDLQPGTNYQYEVVVGNSEPQLLTGKSWGKGQFRTQPFDFPIKIGALGDTGFGDKVTPELTRLMALHEPDMYLALGDLVYWMHQYDGDVFMNWTQKYFLPFQPVLQQAPHYPTIGNHEYDEAARRDGFPTLNMMFPVFTDENFRGQRSWYDFMINNIHFICVNSQHFYSHGYIRQEQEDWLDAQLARTDSRYKVVFFHVAPFNSGAVHQWDGIYVAETWVPKFEQHNVALVLSGHAHLYERLLKNGVHYIVSGAGSETIYGEGESIEHSLFRYYGPCYPLIELYENKIRVQAFDLENQLIDEAEWEI
ncbi:MAG: metallophosphoesterase, partial [Chloroflexi bacterium]|nr:metallophosphoesterase [Chloroflexota bacterium]